MDKKLLKLSPSMNEKFKYLSYSITQKLDLASKWLAVATAAVFPLSTSLMNVFFIAAVVFNLLAGNGVKKINSILRNPVSLMFLVFFAFYVIGVLYTTAPFLAAIRYLTKYSYFLIGAFFFPIFEEDRWRHYAIRAFLGAMAVAVLLSYLKAFSVINYGTWYGPVEVFKGHIAFSFLLAFAAYLLLLEIFKPLPSSGQHKYWRVVLMLYCALIIYDNLFMCISRTGYVVLMALIILFLIQKLHWRGLLLSILAVVLLIGSAFVFSPVFKARVEAAVSDLKIYRTQPLTSVGLRHSFADNSVKLVKAHPILGTGTGSLRYEYAKLSPPPASLTDNPHNEYLNVAVQLGAIGVIYLLFMFAMQLYLSRSLPLPWRYIAQAIVLIIIIGSVANSWITNTTQGHFYAYFIALTFSALPLSVRNTKPTKLSN